MKPKWILVIALVAVGIGACSMSLLNMRYHYTRGEGVVSYGLQATREDLTSPKGDSALVRQADLAQDIGRRLLVEFRNGLTDPVRRSARLEATITQIEGESGRLFQLLRGLSWEDRELLKLVMAENRLRLLDAAVLDVRGDVGTRIAQADAEGETRIRGLLSGELYDQYGKYKRGMAYKEEVSSIASAMRASGVEVNGDLESAILDAYAVAATRYGGKLMAGGAVGDADEYEELIAHEVGKILNDQQLDAFLEAQVQRR